MSNYKYCKYLKKYLKWANKNKTHYRCDSCKKSEIFTLMYNKPCCKNCVTYNKYVCGKCEREHYINE